MSDEGSDSWEVVEESSSEDEENPEYADARLSADVEAFLASAAAFSQSSTAVSTGKADLVQAAADTVEKVAKSEASTTRDKLRRYKTMKKLIRHLKSFLFSTRRPSIFEKCFVESIQANTCASESQGDDLVDGLDMDLRCFPLINGEIQFSPALTQPEESFPQVPAHGTEPLGASSPQEVHQGEDDALLQATSLSSAASSLTGHSVATTAAEGETSQLEMPSQEPAPQKAALQEATPEDILPQDLVHQEAAAMSYSGLVESETPADTWNLRNSPWDSESIWTYDSSSSSCDSHSDVDESLPTCSSSSSSYQVLTDTAEEEAMEAPSPMMVMWLSRRQPEPSEGENPADDPSEAQVLHLTAKLRPPVPDPQPPVLDQAVMAESCQEPLGTETAAGSAAEAAMPAADPAFEAGEQAETVQAQHRELEQELVEGEPETGHQMVEGEPETGHQEDDFRGVPNDQIPEDPGNQEAEAAPWEFAAFAQRCSAYCEWLVEQLSRRLALTPAQARRQLQVMWITSLLLSMAILAVLMLGAFEVSRQALRYEGKSLQAYKEENRMLQAEIQMLNETIQEMRRLHEVEMERCRSAKPKPDEAWGAWGAWEQFRNLWDENEGWSFLDQISAPLKKASTYVQKGVSKTLEDIPKMYDDFVKNTFKTDQVDEPVFSFDKYLYQVRKKLESMGFVFDSDFTHEDLVKFLVEKLAGISPFQSGPKQDEGEQSRGRDGATLHKHGKPEPVPVPEEKPKEESQSKKAEENQGLPVDGQKGSRQVKFHAEMGPHRDGGSGKKEKRGEKRMNWAAMKYVKKLKKLGEKGCRKMSHKENMKVIKQLVQLMKNTDKHPMDLAHAEVDCQLHWWGKPIWKKGDIQPVCSSSIPPHCVARVAKWQLKVRPPCSRITLVWKPDVGLVRDESETPGEEDNVAQLISEVQENYCQGDVCRILDSIRKSRRAHQYKATHNQGHSHGEKNHGEEHAGESHQQKSTDAASQEADTEGKWYEEMMEHRQREHQRKANEKEDWYILRGKARRQERKAARASDWFFDRHQRREWWRNCKNKFWTWMYSYTFGYFR